MLRMDGDIGALLGRGADTSIGKILVKVGFSRDPKRRRDEHNGALPPAGRDPGKSTCNRGHLLMDKLRSMRKTA